MLYLVHCTRGVSDDETSDCYKDFLEKFKKQENARRIEEYKLNDERVFYLDDGATYYDGISYFIDTKCDTVCSVAGEGLNPPCYDDLEFVSLIWKK